MTCPAPTASPSRWACAAALPAVLALAACGGGGEGRAELQLLSGCHLPPMEGAVSPIWNLPQVAGEDRGCTLIVRNAGPTASSQTRFRFVDGDGMHLATLLNCQSAEGQVPCPTTSGGAGALPDIPPGGQFVLTALLTTPAGRNGIASALFEASAANDTQRGTRSVSIDADLRSADLRWGAASAPAQAAPGATVRIEAQLENAGPGDLYPMPPRLLEPAGARLVAVYYRGADGSEVFPVYLGRYPNWGGLAAGKSLRVLIDVTLPATATGPQRLRFATPDSSDPVPGNDLLELSIDVR